MGTWGLLLSKNGDGLSKLVFVQRRQNSCIAARDTSGFSSRLGRTIGTTVYMRRETQGPFPFTTVILGFLSIIKRSEASSPLEGLTLRAFRIAK